jgi:LacI family transcriptional regulator
MPWRRGASSRGRPHQGDAKPRNKRATINDVARVAQVSKKTVSRVINGSPFVHKETRQKIDAIIAELGFVPDPQARGLAFRRSFLIGLICDDPVPDNVVQMLEGILDALRDTSFELVIRACAGDNPKFLQEVRAFVEGQKLFGVLLPPSLRQEDLLTDLLGDLGCAYARAVSGEPLRDAAFVAASSLISTTRPSAP